MSDKPERIFIINPVNRSLMRYKSVHGLVAENNHNFLMSGSRATWLVCSESRLHFSEMTLSEKKKVL